MMRDFWKIVGGVVAALIALATVALCAGVLLQALRFVAASMSALMGVAA